MSAKYNSPREFMIINATKCGILTFTDQALARLERETGKLAVVHERMQPISPLE